MTESAVITRAAKQSLPVTFIKIDALLLFCRLTSLSLVLLYGEDTFLKCSRVPVMIENHAPSQSSLNFW